MQLANTLYILLKVKGFTINVFRKLVERDFNFLSFLDKNNQEYLKQFNIPEFIGEQFKLFDSGKVYDYFEKLDNEGIRVVSYFDQKYPAKLKNIYDPPALLYVQGKDLDFAIPSIAVVGTRKCSSYGMKVTMDLTSQLVSQGIMIISGMAEGIDTCAHRATLNGQGKTIAVLGGGFNHIYPRTNVGLFEEIIDSGMVISEYEPDIEPRRMFFPLRNRIVTGLSDGVMIVEGDIKSGAMISAYLAMDQGKEVFAVPGDITSDISKGPHKLIKEGAKLVSSVEDILEEQPFVRQQSLFSLENIETSQPEKELNYGTLNEIQVKIVKLLSGVPTGIDSIVETTRLSSSEIIAALLELEIIGRIKQHPGKLFTLNRK